MAISARFPASFESDTIPTQLIINCCRRNEINEQINVWSAEIASILIINRTHIFITTHNSESIRNIRR
ncbi:unnamed protein product [Haemonchus placei]|uniref:Uncharacterized protein n=1 Tax=Haemonchus placei TaxID=6290 RepID=A0A0N4X1F5_HAEPC|nr:unnamed protein product [Haemonchus placei]